MRQLELIIAALFLLSPFVASADPIDFDESSDGDLSSAGTLAFDFGANVISGNASCIPGSGCDFDFLYSTLPINSLLESISITLTNAADGNGSFPNVFQVYDSDSEVILNEFVSAGGDFFWTIGQSFSGLDFTGLQSFPGGMSVDYTMTFNVAPVSVPEPGTLALLGFGLAALGMRRRRV